MSFISTIRDSFLARTVAPVIPPHAVIAPRLVRRHVMARRRLQARCVRLRASIEQAVTKRNGDAVRRHTYELSRVLDDLRLLEWIGGRQRMGLQPNTLVISSWLLRDSFHLCTETPDEGMHFLAGYSLDGVTIASRIIRTEYAVRSIASARSEQACTQRALIASHERGHRLVAILHAHPGNGPEANHASGTDQSTQRAFEQNSKIVGGIWSRDGYVRWFSAVHPFTIVVAGSDTEQVDEHLFRLKNMETPPLEV